MIPSSDWVSLDLALFEDSQSDFSSNLHVQDIAFYRVDRYREGDFPQDRVASTLLSGAVDFKDLDREVRELEEGDGLWLDGSEGVVRSLSLAGDHIALSFAGSVRGMRVGTADMSQSLMPRRWEVLRSRFSRILAAVLLAYLAVPYAAARRWRTLA